MSALHPADHGDLGAGPVACPTCGTLHVAHAAPVSLERHRYVLTLAAPASDTPTSAIRRLRFALKCLLRDYGFRCQAVIKGTEGER